MTVPTFHFTKSSGPVYFDLQSHGFEMLGPSRLGTSGNGNDHSGFSGNSTFLSSPIITLVHCFPFCFSKFGLFFFFFLPFQSDVLKTAFNKIVFREIMENFRINI